MIRVTNLTFEYADGDTRSRVLKGIDLTLREGEAVGMMGANGSGKTTLARCLNGLLLPTAGEVVVDGFSTADPRNLPEIRRRVGMVFQNPENQFVSATVEREIAFGLENLGLPHDEMHAIVERMLDRFNLEAYRTHPPHLLSGGEMQRLALAAVVAMSPRYLILDEPTSLLDVPARREGLSLLAQLREQGMAVLLITQYPEEILPLDRLLICHQGKIVFDGPPDQGFRRVEALAEIGVDVPAEYAVNHYLEKASGGTLTLNPSGFLPIP